MIVPFGGAKMPLRQLLACRSDESFLEFARVFGPLGVSAMLSESCRLRAPTDRLAEPLAAWRDARLLLQTAATLWEEASDRRISVLRERLRPMGPNAIGLSISLECLSLARRNSFEQSTQLEDSNTPAPALLIQSARSASAGIVNALLRDHAGVQVDLRTGPGLIIPTFTLLGDMAGEICLWMTGVRRYATGPGCGVLNDITESPTNRRYCVGRTADNCRQKGSRRRRSSME